MDQADIYVPAICRRVLYQNDASNYAVFSAELTEGSRYHDPSKYPAKWIKRPVKPPSLNKSTWVLSSDIPMAAEVIITTRSLGAFKDVVNKPMVFTGKVIQHKKYGQQFEAWGCFTDDPTDSNAMEIYLATLPHIGPERAKILIDRIGSDEIGKVIENDANRIVGLKIGLTEDRIVLVREKWLADIAMREIHMWLAKHNISAHVGKKVISEWKEATIEIIEEDPYRLTMISGIGFKTADDIAYKVLNPVPSEQRVKAAMDHVLDEATKEDGHLCLTYDSMRKKTLELLLDREPEKAEEYGKIIGDSVTSKDPARFSTVKTSDGKIYVYRSFVWQKVRSIAEHLSICFHQKSIHTCSDEDLTFAENELKTYYGKPDFLLNDLQKNAIRSAFENKLTVLTGGGGTGKSTICRAIVKIAQMRGSESGRCLSVTQMAPTGRAAKVLREKTSHHASTIHKALGLMPGDEEPANHISSDILTIDEYSMCGLETAYATFRALRHNPQCNIVLVGDPQQLPSVSPGNFLADIIASGVANVIKLNTIYRQSENSLITTVADEVAKGIAHKIPLGADDIEMQEAIDGDQIVSFACAAMITHLKDGGTIDDIQILAPQYAGSAGVDRINAAIQQLVADRNKVLEKMFAGESVFYVGDKVMQLKNNYEKDVFNGDIGIVKEAGQKILDPKTEIPEPYILVAYDDKDVVYRSGEFSEIKPAWCITIHKFQGSQCRKVVFVMFKGHSYMLNKELVYTGITRAEKHVLVLGNESVLARASRISAIRKRNTTLVEEIGELIGSKGKLLYYNCQGIPDTLPLKAKPKPAATIEPVVVESVG